MRRVPLVTRRRTVIISIVALLGCATAAAFPWRVQLYNRLYHEVFQLRAACLHFLPVTPANEALAGMQVPDGFLVSLVAAEPDVSQPIGMAIDEAGRLWVAECRSYPKWNQRRGDKVLIFADNDGDGRFETRTVFVDGLSNLSGIEVGLGGVWLICSPNLLFIPDADSDGKPDGPAVVVLDGWDSVHACRITWRIISLWARRLALRLFGVHVEVARRRSRHSRGATRGVGCRDLATASPIQKIRSRGQRDL